MTDVRDVIRSLPHYRPEHDWVDADDYYPVYERIVREIQPTSVFEIGTLLGYSLVTFLHAAPSIKRLAWEDNESYIPNSNHFAAENIKAYCQSAGRPVPLPAHLRSDIVHIDGDHTYEGCMNDLLRVFAAVPGTVMVDDVDWHPEVKAAVTDFADAYRMTFEYVKTLRGLAVFRR